MNRLSRHLVYGCRGMICSNSPLAASAGLKVLQEGGNAFDAALAVAAMEAVTIVPACGLGGDAFILLHDATTGTITGINSSGVAATGATSDYYRAQGYQTMPLDGPHAVSVPGAVAAWEIVHRRFCTKPFAQLVDSAIGYAEEGFPIPLGIALTRPSLRRVAPFILTIANTGQALPGYGLLVLFLIFFGQGQNTAIMALALYALLPVLRNTMVGLNAVDRNVLEAGRGMGMTKAGVLARIELPLAVPVIMAGVRTATILCIGMATLAFIIGGGGQYSDEVARRDNNTPAVPRTSPSYWLFNALASYPVTKNLTVRFNVNNLFDREFVQAANNNGARFNPGAPRSYLLTADLRF